MELRWETDENANSKYNQTLLQSLPDNIISQYNIQAITVNAYDVNAADDSDNEIQDNDNILENFKTDLQNEHRSTLNEDKNNGNKDDSGTERTPDKLKEELTTNEDNISYNYVLELQPNEIEEQIAMVTTNVAKASSESHRDNKLLLVNGFEYAENRKGVDETLTQNRSNFLHGETHAEQSTKCNSDHFRDLPVNSETMNIFHHEKNINNENEKESHVGIIDLHSIKIEPEADTEAEPNFVHKTFDELKYRNLGIKQEPVDSEEDQDVTDHIEDNKTVTEDGVQDLDELEHMINKKKLKHVVSEKEDTVDSEEDHDLTDYIENNFNVDELKRIYGIKQKPAESEKVPNIADGVDKGFDKRNNGYNQIKQEPETEDDQNVNDYDYKHHNVSGDADKDINELKQRNIVRKEPAELEKDQDVTHDTDKDLNELKCRNIGIKQEPCEDVNKDNDNPPETTKYEPNISKHIETLDQDMNDSNGEFLEDKNYLVDFDEDTNDDNDDLVEDKDYLAELDEDFMDEIDDIVKDIKPKKKRKGRKQSELTWEERLVCPICNKKFTHPCNRLAHEKMVHRKFKPRVCDICGKGFYSSATLKKHMNSHTGNRPYKCTVCDKGFTQPGNMQRHMKSHALVASYECPICQRAFKEPGNMKRHVETHSDIKKYACKICSKPFRTSSNLQRHIEMIHCRTRNYFCQICDKSFSCADSIRLHMKIHTNERNHVCPTCGKRFMVKTALKRHLAIHLREDEHAFKCGICNKGFKALDTLTGHMVCHTAGNSHICYVCNKSFPNTLKLNEHKLCHSEEKPFVCQVCNKAFSKVHTLRRHALIHGTLKPFSCELCDKTFLYSWYLKTHMNVHIGERPYSCKLCDKAFAYKPSLKSHMRIHTGQRDYLCEVCNKSFSDPGSFKRHEKCRMHNRRVLEAKNTIEQTVKKPSVKYVTKNKSKTIKKTLTNTSLDNSKKKQPVAKQRKYKKRRTKKNKPDI